MVKKKILWFTADFFIDVDRQLVPYLRKNSEFEIRWVVVQTFTGAKIPEHEDYEIWNLHHRAKDPRTFFELKKFFKKAGLAQHDLVYSDALGFYYYPALLHCIGKTPLIHLRIM